MFFPGNESFTTNPIAPIAGLPGAGKYMLGLRHGVVILHNMQTGEVIDANMSQSLVNSVITFDPYWSRPIIKAYRFKNVCYTSAERLMQHVENDIAYPTRLWTTDWVEYGFIDPDGTRFTNQRKGSVDVDLSFISLWELSLRQQEGRVP